MNLKVPYMTLLVISSFISPANWVIVITLLTWKRRAEECGL